MALQVVPPQELPAPQRDAGVIGRWVRYAVPEIHLRDAAMQLVAIGYNGGLMAASQQQHHQQRYYAGNDQARRHARAVSSVQSKCGLCSKAIVIDLVRFDPESRCIKVCSEDCCHESRKPLVYHRDCIVGHMVDTHLDCFKVSCVKCEKYITVNRQLVFKPSELPRTAWRLSAWAFSRLVFWPLICYPVMILLFWAGAMVAWYAGDPGAEYPGFPGSRAIKIDTVNLDLSQGEPQELDSWALKWFSAIVFGYTVSLTMWFWAQIYRYLVPDAVKNLFAWRRVGFNYN